MEPELFIQLLVVNHPVWAAMDMVNDFFFYARRVYRVGRVYFWSET
jgi:hypothetical protein